MISSMVRGGFFQRRASDPMAWSINSGRSDPVQIRVGLGLWVRIVSLPVATAVAATC